MGVEAGRLRDDADGLGKNLAGLRKEHDDRLASAGEREKRLSDIRERDVYLDDIIRDLKRKIENTDRDIKKIHGEIVGLREDYSRKDKRVRSLMNVMGVIGDAVVEDENAK